MSSRWRSLPREECRRSIATPGRLTKAKAFDVVGSASIHLREFCTVLGMRKSSNVPIKELSSWRRIRSGASSQCARHDRYRRTVVACQFFELPPSIITVLSGQPTIEHMKFRCRTGRAASRPIDQADHEPTPRAQVINAAPKNIRSVGETP